MVVKTEMISGRFQTILFAQTVRAERSVIPNSTHFLDVTRATSTSLDVMLEKISTIIGTLMEIENCQIRGQVSHGAPHWMKNLQMVLHDPGSG